MIHLLKTLIGNFISLKKKHFLLIFQNNNELRATGGFITQAIDLKMGKFTLKKRLLDVFGELANHRYIEAPKAIETMLFDGHLDTWTFRDANFDPDFFRSAKQLIAFYNEVHPKNEVCGLLAINFSFVEDLVGVIGPIKLKDRQVDEDGLFYFLSAEVSDIDRHDLPALRNRKKILSELMKKLITKSIVSFWKWPQLIRLIKDSFRRKNLQFFAPKMSNPQPFGPGESQDFLSVIESNFLGLKNNRYIRRSVFHDTQIQANGIENDIRLMWEHFGGYDYPLSGLYRGHVRIYMPKDSQLLLADTQPPMEPTGIYVEDNLKVVEFAFELKPKEKLIVYLKTRLPSYYLHKNDYRFKFFKQPGAQNEMLMKTVSLPHQYSFGDKHTGEIHENTLMKSWEWVEKDLDLNFSFKKNNHAPRIYSHHLVGPETILIKFNEAISYDPETVEIEVFDKGSPDKKFEISALKCDENTLVIGVKDLPSEPEVFYSVVLKNITNQNGVLISPNPRSVTVVYRPKYFYKK